MIRTRVRALAVATTLLAIVAPARVAAGATGSEPPLRLTVGVNDVYGRATACECAHAVASREYDDFLRQLANRESITLEFTYFSEPYQLQKAIADGRFDAVLCKPWPVLRSGSARGGAFRRIADLKSPVGTADLWGEVVVLEASPLRRVRDLAGRKIALGEADAYEKHQAAYELLRSQGVLLAPANVIEKASCLECIDLLLRGEVAAAVISNYALTADCAVDVVAPGQLRTIGRTPGIPLTSLLVDPARVDAPTSERLSRALIRQSAEGLPASMHGGGFIPPQPWNPPELEHKAP